MTKTSTLSLFAAIAILGVVLLISSVDTASADYVFSHMWGENGTGLGQFNLPTGVAVDNSGNVYVVDKFNHRVQKFRPDASFIRAWGEYGTGDGQFAYPHGIAVDSVGNVYVSEWNNHRIQKFTVTGDFITSWGSSGSRDGQFKWPSGIDVDTYGHVYVADSGNHRIQKFTNTGGFVAKWGSHGSGNGQFDWPADVAVYSHPTSESLGTVYVVDDGNNRIQVFHTYGSFSTKWGTPGSGNGQFNNPIGGIDVESPVSGPSPKVFVADTYNNRIQQIGFLGLFLAKWGSPGSGEGQFSIPYSVAEYTGVGGAQKVYVADTYNGRIQAFTKQ